MLLLLFVLVFAGVAAAKNVVLVVADDLGYAWFNSNTSSEVVTPRIDALRESGVVLERMYGHYSCSPSRCALLSGRQPLFVNAGNGAPERSSNDTISGYAGISLGMTTLAEKLEGYATFAFGKWDVGYATPDHTPLGRGFDHFLGYFHHDNDYWTGAYGDETCDGATLCDFWLDDGPSFLMEQPNCSQKAQEGCVYEDDLLASRVAGVLANTNRSRPVFAYWAPHLVHGPYAVPEAEYDEFAYIETPLRRMMAAMVSKLDTALGVVVDAAASIWDETALFLVSDNGGPVVDGGGTAGASNNWPLRGGKYGPLEGGIRLAALVSGGLIPPANRKRSVDALLAINDIYATICAIANVSKVDEKAARLGLPPVDGQDFWPLVLGDATRFVVRSEVVIAGGQQAAVGLVTSDLLKLLVRNVSGAIWTGPQYPNASSMDAGSALEATVLDCDHYCLFDLATDPLETTNLAARFPDAVDAMRARLEELDAAAFRPDRGDPNSDLDRACAVALANYSSTWGPWLPSPPPLLPEIVAHHFVYGAHHVLGAWLPRLRDSADIGSLMTLNKVPHKAMDLLVHLGFFLAAGRRPDHCLAAALHVGKYAGYPCAGLLPDLLDVASHTVSAVGLLGPEAFALALLIAELHRLLLLITTTWAAAAA
ncbi:hypothetical protein CTAYLR_006190 [Chrysophaeum taylorii]|uniref:Sulfatase N-terminal domain-containing protein n=1 Tax=Chrysophaeum taylorii TaxID=2483200 RepID=A0AAD7UMP2_9STRA|nr:hypothetical protein CTAYLR_006190 [Chrysophaeum taylorii]